MLRDLEEGEAGDVVVEKEKEEEDREFQSHDHFCA